jgi:O-antigen biosynthesis protein
MERAGITLYPDLPTGVGFCLYIRRALIEAIGLFDVAAFGRGYGEENDFCLRAVQAGYRNVLCSDVYVAHRGQCSFGEEKNTVGEQQMAVLLDKHPHYLEEVERFIEQDPLQPLRQVTQTQLQIVSSAEKPGVLHVVHALPGRGGGVEKYINNLTGWLAEPFRHHVLIALEEEWIVRELSSAGEEQSYHFQPQAGEAWADFLAAICGWLEIRLCHIHQIAGCREGLLHALLGAELPYGVSVHDFFLACPTINLLDSQGNYCGAVTEHLQCRQCLEAQGSLAGINIAQWRQQHQGLLAKAAFVLAPSAWSGQVFNRYFPEVPVTVLPNVHPRVLPKPGGGRLRCFLLPQDGIKTIGVLGAIGPVKGARKLEQLVERTRARKLPLRWVVIGYTDRQGDPPVPYQSEDWVLTLHGFYEQEDLPHLLNHYAVSLVVFPSAGPETFSYTLSEAWAAGRPVLVPPLGALQERVMQSGAGWIMEDWQDVDKILAQVMDLAYAEATDRFTRIVERCQQAWESNEVPLSRQINELYQQSLAPLSLPALKRMAPLRVYAAACYQADEARSESSTLVAKQAEVPGEGGAFLAGSRKPRLSRVRAVLLEFSLRFRHTSVGRWTEHKLPASWHHRLRRFLLSG